MPYISEDDPKEVRTSLLVGLALFCAIALFCLMGCKTCPPPQIIYKPEPYPVYTYEPPPPLEVPAEPQMEPCGSLGITEKVRCVGSNIVALMRYSQELRATIEAHNAALEATEGGTEVGSGNSNTQ